MAPKPNAPKLSSIARDLARAFLATKDASAALPYAGLVTPGNINLGKRPVVHSPDGSYSTLRSMTVTDDDGKATLLPTVSPDGRIMSNDEALKMYRDTGQHLGIFQNEDLANQAGEKMHRQQAFLYGGLT